MTTQEKNIIINEILDRLAIESKLIEELQPVTEVKETDLIELNGGRYVTLATLLKGGDIDLSKLKDLFLSKTKADRTLHLLTSDKGFEVGDFVSGVSGAMIGKEADTGHTFGEMDKLFIRVKAYFESLTVIEANTLAGKQYITPGGAIKCTSVEEVYDGATLTGWRCYFLSEQDGEKTETKMIVGDQAISEMFNAKTGTTNKVSNHRYWRLVTAVSNDAYEEKGNHYGYIELSASNCEAGSDIPEAGDVLCQLGYQGTGNKERQTAMVFSTVDSDAPSIKMFAGIDSYSLADKAIISFGRDPLTNQVYFRLGSSTAKEYLSYTQQGGLKVAGSITTTSTIGDKTLNQYFTDLIPEISQEDIESYVNAIVDPKIDGIQNQIDGVIETWFSNGVPTLSNYPASEWNDNQKIAHLGDLYYDNDTGTAYRFSQNTQGGYYWNVITDDAITKALAASKEAYDLADGKRRTFVAQPAPPYSMGDIWVNATYGTQYNNDILRCITAKTDGQTFNIADWTLASKYTDDSALNQFISDYNDTIDDIKGQLDGKAETWYQATDPSTAWNTDALKALHVGDLWYNTTNGTTWYWNGNQWEQQNIPDSVFDKIDGKADIYVSKPTSYHKNDLWFLEAEYTLSGGKHDAGTLVVALHDMGADGWKASDWAKKDRYTDDTLAQSAKDEADSLGYLKQSFGTAIADSTHINGGLILSTMIALGYTEGEARRILSGMNGSYITALGGRTPAAWYGGNMIDRFDKLGNLITPTPTDAATSMIRMDGSAYFANGNAGFEIDGSGWFGDRSTGNAITFANGAMTFGSGIKINLTSGIVGLKETLESFANMLTFFIPVRLDGTPTQWGASDMAGIKTTKHFYSEGEISAYGYQESQGGSVGVDESQVNTLISNYLTLNNYAKKSDIPSAPDLSVYAKKSDIPSLSGYATESWVLGKNYLTQHQSLADYLKKTDAATTYLSKTDAATQYQPKGSYALSSELSTHTGNNTVHITATERSAWNAKLDASVFNELFAKETVGGKTVIKAKFSIYSVEEMSAYGYAQGIGGTGGVGINKSELAQYLSDNGYATKTWVRNENYVNVGSDGVSEIGRYLDFHTYSNGIRGSEDYTARLDAGSAATARVLSLPTTSGTLATQEWVDAKNFIKDAGDGRSLQFNYSANSLGYDNFTWVAVWNGNTLQCCNKNVFASAASLADYAKLWSPNNLIHSGNEFTFIPDSFTGESVWLNYRFGADGNTGKLKEYHFGNGTKGGRANLVANGFVKYGGTASQALMADGSVRSVNIPTTTSHLGWADTKGQLTTIDTIAFWNGRYNANTSNLQYCDRGRFGTMATANASDYLPLTGGTLKNGANECCFNIDTDSANEVGMRFKMGGVTKGWTGFHPTQGANLYNYNCGKYLGIRDNGEAYVRNCKMWHEGNDGTGSGLDADLLDGWHVSSLFRWQKIDAQDLDANTLTGNPICYTTNGDMNGPAWAGKGFANFPTSRPDGGFCLLHILEGNYAKQIYTRYNDNHLYIRNRHYNATAPWSAWSTLALTSDNVASATKLANTRTIWGQNFNGEGNVSGDMTGVGTIKMNRYLFLTWNTAKGQYFVANDAGGMSLNLHDNYIYTGSIAYFSPDGNVGIGTTNPTQKCDINGNLRAQGGYFDFGLNIGKSDTNGYIEIYHATPYIDFHFGRSTADYTTRIIEEASGRLAILGTLRVSVGMYSDGYVSARGQNTSSDERLKNIIGKAELSLSDIANAPSVRFLWKKDGKEDVGSIAQYWRAIIPQLAPDMPDGTMGLQYGKTALLGLIPVASEVERLKRRIAKLERRLEEAGIEIN